MICFLQNFTFFHISIILKSNYLIIPNYTCGISIVLILVNDNNFITDGFINRYFSINLHRTLDIL